MVIFFWFILNPHLCVSSPREGKEGLLTKTRKRLTDIVRVCFFQAGRSIAHKCARFLALCIRWETPKPLHIPYPWTLSSNHTDSFLWWIITVKYFDEFWQWSIIFLFCPCSNGKGEPGQQGFGMALLKALLENMPYLPAAATGGRSTAVDMFSPLFWFQEKYRKSEIA